MLRICVVGWENLSDITVAEFGKKTKKKMKSLIMIKIRFFCL